jgi:hypothetical protein
MVATPADIVGDAGEPSKQDVGRHRAIVGAGGVVLELPEVGFNLGWKSCASTEASPRNGSIRSARTEVTPSWCCSTPSTSRNGCPTIAGDRGRRDPAGR